MTVMEPRWLRRAHSSCCSSACASLHASSSRSRALMSSRRVRWRGGIAQYSPVNLPRQISHRGYWRWSCSSPASSPALLSPALTLRTSRL
jgi:hypothetical protein